MRTIEHGPIEKLDDGVWRVEGSLPRAPIRRVMTILKRADGALVVHSGIALTDEELAELDSFGKVGFIFVPNAYHRIDAKQYADQYPDAKVLCPSGVREAVEKVVRVSATYEEFPKDDAVSIAMLGGTGNREGAVIARGKNGATLVFNDAIFNMPHLPGFMGFMIKNVMGSSGGPKVTRITKLALVKDTAAFKASLLELAATPHLKRIIVSHHQVIEKDPAATLRAVAEALG